MNTKTGTLCKSSPAQESMYNILLLGFKDSGKQKLIRCLSKRAKLSSEVILTANIKLPKGDKAMLYSINPEKHDTKALKPILKVIDAAVLLINPHLTSACVAKQLDFLIGYCRKQRIVNMSIGVWYDSDSSELADLDKIYTYLHKCKLTPPVVIVENSDRDDIDILVESACASLAFS